MVIVMDTMLVEDLEKQSLLLPHVTFLNWDAVTANTEKDFMPPIKVDGDTVVRIFTHFLGAHWRR